MLKDTVANLTLPSLHGWSPVVSFLLGETQFSEKKLKMKLMVSFVEYWVEIVLLVLSISACCSRNSWYLLLEQNKVYNVLLILSTSVCCSRNSWYLLLEQNKVYNVLLIILTSACCSRNSSYLVLEQTKV